MKIVIRGDEINVHVAGSVAASARVTFAVRSGKIVAEITIKNISLSKSETAYLVSKFCAMKSLIRLPADDTTFGVVAVMGLKDITRRLS